MKSCVLCQPWTAYQAYRMGLLTDVVSTLRQHPQGPFVPNPLVITDRYLENGKIVYGEPKQGDALAAGKVILKSGQIDFSLLDQAVDKMVSDLLMTMPGCTSKTVESLRKHKLQHWDRNRETNRAWLAQNMMTEAMAGFRAFNLGTKDDREADFVLLRQRIAEGTEWSAELVESLMPKKKKV